MKRADFWKRDWSRPDRHASHAGPGPGSTQSKPMRSPVRAATTSRIENALASIKGDPMPAQTALGIARITGASCTRAGMVLGRPTYNALIRAASAAVVDCALVKGFVRGRHPSVAALARDLRAFGGSDDAAASGASVNLAL